MGIGSQVSTAAEQAGKAGRTAGGAVSPRRLAELAAEARARLAAGPMSPEDAQRAAQRGERIDAITLSRLAQQPAAFADEVAPAIVAATDVTAAPRPFGRVGNKGPLVSDADQSVIVRPMDDGEHFAYPDGTVVDVYGNVVGTTTVGDLTDVGRAVAVDNLDASATDLGGAKPGRGGKDNLTPKTAKSDPVADLAGSIWQMTTPQDTESVSQQSVKSLLRAAQKYRTADGTYDPAFIAAFPNEEAGLARLNVLEQMAGVSNADRAAEQIDTAAQAVAAANAPRPPAGNRAATQADFQAAKELVGESLPAGDWSALTAAFNKMDDDQRQAVLAALPSGTRQFLAGMLDPNQQSPSFLPNLVAERTRPINEVDELIAQRDAAVAAGDNEAAATINDLLRGKGSAPQEDITDAIRAVNDRQSAAAALRAALLGNDPFVRAEKIRMQQAAVPQPQPAAITPGARTPEFAAEDIPAGEMPTAYDHVRAAQRETQRAVDARAAGDGLSEAERLDAMGGTKQRDLPLFLRGRDRNPPMESRSRGERSIESNDRRAIDNALDLQQEVDSAQAEVDAALANAQSAAGAAELARATQRLREAFSAMDNAYPPRIVNARTGEVKAYDGGDVPKGWAVERGRKAMSDSRLNKGGQQETYDDLIVSMTGFRPRPQSRLDRASDGLSSADAEAMSAEAGRVFGDDADGLLEGDFDPDWEVDPLDIEANGSRKPSRLGGQQQASRVEGASQQMFGDTNPFGMTDGDDAPLFKNADAVAEEILSRGTLFKPGTANYDLAKERIAQVIERKFANAAKTNPRDAQSIPDPEGLTDAVVAGDAAADGGVINNLESSATDLGSSPIEPVVEGGKPKRGGRRSKKDAAETPAAVEAPAAGDSVVKPVTGRKKTMVEIQAEADAVGLEARRAAIDSGESLEEAVKAGNRARKAHVDAEKAAQKSAAPEAAPVNAVEGDKTPVPTAAADDATAAAKPVAAEAAPATPDTAAPEPARVADVTGDVDKPVGRQQPTPVPPAPKTWWGRTKQVGGYGLGLAGLGLAGGVLVNNMGGSGGADGGGGWALPPGAGEGGEFTPVPDGGAGGATVMDADAEAAELARLNHALDRIRGAGAMSNSGPAQTILNYNRSGF